MNDATWIADLVACGLIKASFVPEEAIQDLRPLLRAREQLIREQTSHIQRIQKTLEEATIASCSNCTWGSTTPRARRS